MCHARRPQPRSPSALYIIPLRSDARARPPRSSTTRPPRPPPHACPPARVNCPAARRPADAQHLVGSARESGKAVANATTRPGRPSKPAARSTTGPASPARPWSHAYRPVGTIGPAIRRRPRPAALAPAHLRGARRRAPRLGRLVQRPGLVARAPGRGRREEAAGGIHNSPSYIIKNLP